MPQQMSAAELDTISQALLPGASKNKRADRVGELTGYKRRMVYNWFLASVPIPELVADKLRSEHRKALKRQAKKDTN